MGAASTFRSLLALSLLCYGTVEAAPHKPMHLAFVLLSEATMPKAETIASAFVRFAAKGDQLVVSGTKSDGKIAVLTFDVGTHGTAFVAMTPMPVPKGEADAFARYSLASLGSKWKLPPHKAHLVVSLTGHDGEPALDTLNRFTSLLAAVTQSAPAVGVYWGDAGATHDPKLVLSAAAEPGVVPRITLWTGVSVAAEGTSRVSLLSLGMKQLALPDLLLTAPKDQMGNALETFFDLLAYVVDRGSALPEGDTVGRSDTERLPVHYVKSPRTPSERVWRVDLN